MNRIIDLWKNFTKPKCLAFVLSGGGSRGAFQAGALQALQEAGLQPDLLVGTSIGAVNAAFLAINGFSAETIQALKEVWRDAARSELLPTNYLWLTVRGLFRREVVNPTHRLRDFFIKHGVSPELRFADLQHQRLVTVSADLNSSRTISHGANPEERVLDAVLASAALPPWVTPIHQEDRYLIDGGFLSSLPVEPAMAAGATEIYALDLSYRVNPANLGQGFGTFLEKLVVASELRQGEIEIALARARKIPLTHIRLEWPAFIPPWDFQHTETLMAEGYRIAQRVLAEKK